MITTAFLARVSERTQAKIGAWFELREEDGGATLSGEPPPSLALDHEKILLAALRTLSG